MLNFKDLKKENLISIGGGYGSIMERWLEVTLDSNETLKDCLVVIETWATASQLGKK